MQRNRTIALLFAIVSAFATTQTHAVQRTHVSAAIGVDTNAVTGCTPVAPCRTFQAAMAVTDVNGEVVVLDSGGYGAVTINQSVALIAPKGVYAGISVFEGFDGVTIATPGINVALRGISINGQGGNSGVLITAAKQLTVENCVISNLRENGISAAGNSIVRVTDTIIRDNLGDGISFKDGTRGTITRATIFGNSRTGIAAQGRAIDTVTSANIADSTISGNIVGVELSSSFTNAFVNVSIRDSRITGSPAGGLRATAFNGAPVSLSASNNIVSNNREGISAFGAGVRVWASGNTVSDNTRSGLENLNGAIFQSAGNNAVRNNQLDISGTIPIVGMR